MTTLFSDFLSAHAARIAQLWATQVRAADAKVEAGRVRDPRQFVNAVLVAMSADDLRRLITLYQLEEPRGLEDRLNTALRHLQTVRRVADEAAREQGVDFESRLGLTQGADEELGEVMRRLATGTTGTLGTLLSTATSASSAQGTSLSITMHELRRPLTILNSYGQLLATGMLGTLPESATVAIEGITASTEMMVRMVSALAELGRLEDPDDRMALEVVSGAEVVGGEAPWYDHRREHRRGSPHQRRSPPSRARADQLAGQRRKARPAGFVHRGLSAGRERRCPLRGARSWPGIPAGGRGAPLRQVFPVGRRAQAQGSGEWSRSVHRAHGRGAARRERRGADRRWQRRRV